MNTRVSFLVSAFLAVALATAIFCPEARAEAPDKKTVAMLPIRAGEGVPKRFAKALESALAKKLASKPFVSLEKSKFDPEILALVDERGFTERACAEIFPEAKADFVCHTAISAESKGKQTRYTLTFRAYMAKEDLFFSREPISAYDGDDKVVIGRLVGIFADYLVPVIENPEKHHSSPKSNGLHTAIRNNDVAAAEKVLAEGANPNWGMKVTLQTTSNGKIVDEREITEYPVSRVLSSQNMALKDKLSFLELLSRHKANFNVTDHENRSPLQVLFMPYRSKDGRAELALALLRGGADPDHLDKPDGWSILQTVIANKTGMTEKEHLALVTVLVEKGASLEHSNKSGDTALFTAVDNDEYDIASLLLRHGANIYHRNADGKNALFRVSIAAETQRQIAMFRLLFENGVERNGYDSPLWRYVYDDKNLPVIEYLISAGLNINVCDEDGRTITEYARTESKAAYNLLTSKGGKRFAFQLPASNSSPACAAVLAGDVSAFKALSQVEISALQARTTDGVPATVLHLAVEKGDVSFLRAIASVPESWNVPDRYRRTPLLLAVMNGRQDIAELLMSKGADPNLADDSGATAYFRAAGSSAAMLGSLSRFGPVPRNADPAFVATMSGDTERVKIMVKSIRKECERRAGDLLSFAVDFGYTDVAAYLAGEFRASLPDSSEALKAAKENRNRFEAYEAKGSLATSAGRKEDGSISDKRGSFTHVLEEWSPWRSPELELKLGDYPVGVHVPASYDPAGKNGLIVFMSWNLPDEAYKKVLEEKRIVWIGFDCYKIKYQPLSEDRRHETMALAMAYAAMRNFSIDPARVYIGGMSWGGRLSGRIASRNPNVFTGAITTAGSQVDNWETNDKRFHDGLRLAQRRLGFAITTGDYDYNRGECLAMRTYLLDRAYRNVLYLQQAHQYHGPLSADNFARVIDFFDSRKP